MAKTIGERIEERVAEVISLSESIHKDKTRGFWQEAKTIEEVVEICITEEHIAIFIAENVVKEVRKHYGIKK